MHDKASGAHDSNQQHRGFPHDKNSTNMHPSAAQKTVPMVYWDEDFVLASFSLAILCDAIPCSVILFLDQSNASSFHHPPRCCEESCYL